MRPTPQGWPRASISVWYEDPLKAIDWLAEAFGFEVQMKILGEGGRLEHSELRFGEAMIMIGAAGTVSPRENAEWRKSPRQAGGCTQAVMIYVDDVDAHCARARKAGGTIATEPANTDYGDDYWEDRGYECVDPEGHHWWFYQRLRDAKS